MGEVPAFRFPDSQGGSLGLEDLRGKVWAADFIFTRCAGPCPLITGRFAELQGSLPPGSPVRLVSFTVDPEFDTPEVLKKYAENYGAMPEVWHFLRGDKTAVFNLSEKGFFLAAGDGKDDPDHAIFHSSRIVLVDARGRIRGYYDSEGPKVKDSLLKDIATLLREEPSRNGS